MKITVREKLIVQNPTPAVIRWCQEHLVIDNPEYYKKELMGKWTGNVPRDIYLYERCGDDLLLPFGVAKDIWRLCVRGVSWDVQIASIRRLEYHSGINLYPYQEKAVSRTIEGKNGILVMPCGSGKTQSGIEIISRIGGRALWLTHTQDLLNQSKKRAESVLSGSGFGTITSGKVDIGSHITFATIQTMCKIDLSAYRDFWDVIIVDECQHCCGSPTKVTQFYKVLSNLSARYKIGLTATPKRADGLEASMFALLGGILCEITKEEVAHITCPIHVKQISTGWYPNDDITMFDGTIDYSKVIDSMIHDKARFEFIAGMIRGLKGSAIVLANRVEYLQKLAEAVSVDTEDYYGRLQDDGEKCACLSGMGQSKKAKEERKEALRKLNDGELDCVFCTYQLAAEGLDVPTLRYVVFATPEKDPTRIQQASGRVGRKAPNKDCGIVIDFVDAFGMYQSWKKKREAVYKKLGYDII